jgi:hypothetical protein
MFMASLTEDDLRATIDGPLSALNAALNAKAEKEENDAVATSKGKKADANAVGNPIHTITKGNTDKTSVSGQASISKTNISGAVSAAASSKVDTNLNLTASVGALLPSLDGDGDGDGLMIEDVDDDLVWRPASTF